jgi:hypothetical protein
MKYWYCKLPEELDMHCFECLEWKNNYCCFQSAFEVRMYIYVYQSKGGIEIENENLLTKQQIA